MKEKYDVIVIGGGCAGICAAAQSAREGADTLLVEKNEILGGTLSGAHVTAPGLFHAWKKQIIGGIGFDIVKKCREEEGLSLPDYSHQEKYKHPNEQIAVNPALFALLADETVTASGAEILFDTMCAAIKEDESGKTVTLCTKEGLKDVRCTVLIDCTGDANAVTMAGYEVERSAECQPGTYGSYLVGYEKEDIHTEALAAAFDKEVEAGRMSYTDASWNPNAFEPKWLIGRGRNGNHVFIEGVTGETSEGKTKMILEARRTILKLYRFFRKQEGLNKLKIQSLASECGIRETVRIKGKKTVTKDDYLAGRRYGDDICYTYYPIDLHIISVGVPKTYLDEYIVPTIPRGALLPEGSKNFLTAGRCVSSDQLANSAIRVQATCMAEGQAAGALAALAVKGNVDVEDVPMEALYEVLERNGAIVPRA